MVRKWSYLESNFLDLHIDSLSRLTSLYHFKVFRKTTRFKKFNRGITRMVRRNYARRKHQTNWLILSYITKSWVLNYLKTRQFERFYNSLGKFPISAFTSDTSVFLLKHGSILNKNGINIISCSKSVLMKHINYSSGAQFLLNPTKNTNSAIIQANTAEDLTLSLEVYPNLVNLDNLLYSYEEMAILTKPQHNVDFINNLNQLMFKNTTHIVTTAYNILVLSTLTNVNRSNYKL